MTFEKVLSAFSSYLAEDTDCEVIFTKHGYTVLIWDNTPQGWAASEWCGTPEDLCETLLDAYKTYAELRLTGAARDLLPGEVERIEENCMNFRKMCS